MANDIAKRIFIEDHELVSENVGEGVIRKLIAYDDRLMLVKVIFEKGAIGALHHHYHSQMTYVEKGVFEVNINEGKKILCAGSSFYVPPDAPHGVICLEPGILIDVFSPMREDFIQQ